MNKPQDPRTWRDNEYPTTSVELEGPTGMPAVFVPIESTVNGAHVWIASEEEQEELETSLNAGGDLMTGIPSIYLTIDGEKVALTWADAYNLGRALIDKANEAFYG